VAGAAQNPWQHLIANSVWAEVRAGDAYFGDKTWRIANRRVLRRVELGINFIDTADSYGPGVSEEIIAEALHPYPAGLVIATKGGFMRPGPNQWRILL